MLLPIAFKWSLWTQPAGEHVHFAMQAAHVRQGTECHVFLELCCPASASDRSQGQPEQCSGTKRHFLNLSSDPSGKQRRNATVSTCCNALSCLLFFISVLVWLESSNQHLAAKKLPDAITEKVLKDTVLKQTSEIKGTALFSCVAFCCPVILYVDYNRKIRFLIFPSLYLEQCKNSYTWSLWALLSHIHLLILCHCHLSDSGLLACMRS